MNGCLLGAVLTTYCFAIVSICMKAVGIPQRIIIKHILKYLKRKCLQTVFESVNHI